MRHVITLMILGILLLSCTDSKTEKKMTKELNEMQQETDSLLNTINQNKLKRTSQIASFLTFQDGNAENAMNFYVELFGNSKIMNVNRWGKGAPTAEGKIMQATFELDGNLFMCSDSPPIHEWNFTPAISIYVEEKTEEKINKLFEKLSEGGKIMMPLDNYGFSKKFGFVEDKFGVSWQLNLVE